MPPSEVDRLEFYMIEYLIEDMEEKINEEEKRYKKQEDEQKKQQKAQSSSTPKVGKTDYGGFKTPKINVPTPKMPSIPKPRF